MGDLAPLFYLALLGLGVAAALVFIYRRRRKVVLEEDNYTRGLELWLAGEHQGAVAALRVRSLKHDLPPWLLDRSEAHQPPFPLVPEVHPERSEALPEGQRLDRLHRRDPVVASL